MHCLFTCGHHLCEKCPLALPSAASPSAELVLVDRSEAGAGTATVVLAPNSLSPRSRVTASELRAISLSMFALALLTRRLLRTK